MIATTSNEAGARSERRTVAGLTPPAWRLLLRLTLTTAAILVAFLVVLAWLGVVPLTVHSAVGVGWMTLAVLVGGPGILLAAFLALVFIQGGIIAVNKQLVNELLPAVRHWLERVAHK